MSFTKQVSRTNVDQQPHVDCCLMTVGRLILKAADILNFDLAMLPEKHTLWHTFADLLSLEILVLLHQGMALFLFWHPFRPRKMPGLSRMAE